jgi:hypothetical protein
MKNSDHAANVGTVIAVEKIIKKKKLHFEIIIIIKLNSLLFYITKLIKPPIL